MNPRLFRTVLAMVMAAMVSTLAYGQGATTSLSGSVVDTSGAVVPGADVSARNDATGVVYTALTGAQGNFTIPSMNIGTYTVTVSLMGFKQAIVPGVALSAAVPGTVKITMEIGAVTETVVVQGGSEIVQTQSTTIASTLRTEQIQKLPLVSRDVMWGALTTLAGFNTTGGPRGSTVVGLPASALNITLDGVNVQDNMLHNDFFSLISPRLDAIEEVTVTSAASSAESTGQGAVQIRMVTRSGSNQFSGSGYYYMRHPDLNSNYWFTNRDVPPDPTTGKSPRAQTKLYQPGFRVGGPIMLPKFDGHDKAFFFFNFEQFRQPSQVSRTRTVMGSAAQQGNYQYVTSAGVRSVNVLQLAAGNGQVAQAIP